MMNIISALQLFQLQVQTLFVLDENERMCFINEPGDEQEGPNQAPRFFLGRTAQGNIWRFRHDLPAGLVQSLEHLCRAEPVTESFITEPVQAPAIRTLLREHALITSEYRGPAYSVPDSLQVHESVVEISESNAHFLKPHFPWAILPHAPFDPGPIAAFVVRGSAVSICFCSRLSQRAAEAGVETAEAFRGKGYASAVVAGWASAVRRRGLVPLYSTSWDNAASQGVARKLGMQLYGEEWSIT